MDVWAFFIFPFPNKNSCKKKTATYSHSHVRIHVILNFCQWDRFPIRNKRVSLRIFSPRLIFPYPIPLCMANISYLSCIRILVVIKARFSYSIHVSCKTIIVMKTFQINMKSLRVHCAVIWLVEFLLPFSCELGSPMPNAKYTEWWLRAFTLFYGLLCLNRYGIWDEIWNCYVTCLEMNDSLKEKLLNCFYYFNMYILYILYWKSWSLV